MANDVFTTREIQTTTSTHRETYRVEFDLAGSYDTREMRAHIQHLASHCPPINYILVYVVGQ